MKAGWEVKPLGEVIEKLETVDPRKTPDIEFDYVDVSSVSKQTYKIEGTTRTLGANAPSRARRKIRTNDVIFATIRPTLQRIAFVPSELDDQICSTGYMVLRAKQLVLSKFIYYFLFSDAYSSAMEKLQKGASYPAVTDGEVRQQPIPLPPLDEQKRIVAVLDAAFDGLTRARAHAEANLQNARELFERYADNMLSTIGEDWITHRFGDVIDFLNGYAFKSSDTVSSSKVQLIRMGNLYQNNLNLERKPSFYPDAFAEEYRRFEVVEGDIILSLTGTVGKRDYGYAVRVPEVSITLLLNQRIAKFINIDEGLIVRPYLLFLLRSATFLDLLYNSANGTRQANLSTVEIKKFAVSLPPVEEQVRICEKLGALQDYCSDLETQYQQKITDIDNLRQSLLQKAFAGELT